MLLFLAACSDAALGPDKAGDTGTNVPADTDTGGTTGDSGGTDTEDTTAPPLGELTLSETLHLAELRWGVDVPNTVKSYPSAWDPVTETMWVTGIQLPNLLQVDPVAGHPIAGITLPIEGHHSPLLRIDPERRLLYWISRGNGAVVVVDLDTGDVVARNDQSYAADSSLIAMAITSAEVDPATGNLWLCDVMQHVVLSYGPALGSTRVVDDIANPQSMALDGVGGLYVYDGDAMMVKHFDPEARAWTDAAAGDVDMGLLAVTKDGELVLADNAVHLFDTSGTERWSAELPGGPLGLATVGDTVAVTSSDLTLAGEEAVAIVHLFDVTDGEKTITEVGYGAEHIAEDDEGQRLIVSNGSDGSLTVVDAVSREAIQTIPVANVPDGTAYDPVTGFTFVLDRLGGSVIHSWDGTSLETFSAGAWPTELLVDTDRRLLMAATHFDSSLARWDLDTREALPTLSFGAAPNASDTVGDIAYAPSLGVAAMIFPETGSLSVLDVETGEVKWEVQFPDLLAGEEQGSGESAVVVDPAHDLLLVYDAVPRRIVPFVLSSGERLPQVTLPEQVDPPSYVVSPMWLSDDGSFLIVDELVINVPELDVITTLPHDVRALCSQHGRVYGMALGEDQASESLVVLDPDDGFAEIASFLVGTTTGMRMDSRCDVERGTLMVADLEAAEIRTYSLP